MEGQPWLKDASLKGLTEKMESLEKMLEVEMLSHNSEVVRSLQQQLNRLQGEYNDKVVQLIMSLPTSTSLSENSNAPLSFISSKPSVPPPVHDTTPSSPERGPARRKRKRAESPKQSGATKLFRPTPTTELEAPPPASTQISPVDQLEKADTSQINQGEQHTTEMEASATTDSQPPAVPIAVAIGTKTVAEVTDPIGKEPLPEETRLADILQSFAPPEIQNYETEREKGTIEESAPEGLNVEMRELKLTIERLSNSLGVSERQVAETQLRLRDADTKYQDALAELARERKQKEDYSRTLREMAAAQEEAVAQSRGEVQGRLNSLMGEMRVEREHSEQLRQQLAARAEEIASLGDELDALRKQLRLVQDANNELVETKNANEREIQRLKAAQGEQVQGSDQENILLQQLEEANRTIAEQKHHLERFKATEHELSGALESTRQQNEELKRSVHQLAAQKEAVEQELNSSKQQAQEKGNLDEILRSSLSENQELKADIEKIRGYKQRVTEEVSVLRAELQAYKEQESKRGEIEKQRRAEEEKLRGSLQDALEEVSRLTRELQDKESNSAGFKARAEEKEAQMKELQVRLTKVQEVVREREAQVEKFKEQHSQLEKENATLHSTIDERESANRTLMLKLQEALAAKESLNELKVAQEEQVSAQRLELEELRKQGVAMEEWKQKIQSEVASLEDVQSRLKAAESESEERRLFIEKLQHHLSQEKEKLSLLAKQQADKEEQMKVKIAALQEESAQLKASFKKLEKASKEANEREKSLQDKLKEEEEKNKQYQAAEEKVQQEIDDLKRESEETAKDLRNKLAKQRNDAEALRVELEKLTKAKSVEEEKLRNELKQREERLDELEKEIKQNAVETKTNGKGKGSSQEKKASPRSTPEEPSSQPGRKTRGAKRGREEEQPKEQETSSIAAAVKRRRKAAGEEIKEEAKPKVEKAEAETDDDDQREKEAAVVASEQDKSKRKADALQSPTKPVEKKLRAGLKAAPKRQSLDKGIRPVMVYFSGFKDEAGWTWTNELKNELAAMVGKLGGQVRLDAEFDAKITHVVTPPNCRTMKTLAAALTHRWLVSPEWVVDSDKEGRFIDETNYGIKYAERPFEGKVFYLSKNFCKENAGGRDYKVKNAHTLATSLGKGTIVTEGNAQVDFTMVGKEVDQSDVYGKVITWNDFVNMIPGSGKTFYEKGASGAAATAANAPPAATATTTTTTATQSPAKKGVRFAVPKESPEKGKKTAAEEPKSAEKRTPSKRGSK